MIPIFTLAALLVSGVSFADVKAEEKTEGSAAEEAAVTGSIQNFNAYAGHSNLGRPQAEAYQRGTDLFADTASSENKPEKAPPKKGQSDQGE